MQKILVAGGGGYIGSHTAKALAMHGFLPVVYDNLVHGHRCAVQWGPFVEGDIGDKTKLRETISIYEIDAVVHLAAYGYVGESMAHPERYFDNNVTRSLALMDAVIQAGVRYLVFSSSCATYGTPERLPITEQTLQRPVNPYGETKLIIERALQWYSGAHDLSCAVLRYFNAAGADADGDVGEDHNPESHLIPLVLDAALGRTVVDVFGDDYSTPDGTCVRDYIHVSDLADAHVLALKHLIDGRGSVTLNLGTGAGHSIKEVISMVEKVTRRHVPHRFVPRREGDPAALVADASLSAKILGWSPQHSDLENIVDTAWRWHTGPLEKRRTPDGSGS